MTGGWDTTSAIAAGGAHSLTESRVGNYLPSSTSSITFPRVVLGADPILRFSHIAIVAFGDIAFVEISRNNRQTWTTLKVYNLVGHAGWTDLTADPGDWETQLFDLHGYQGDSVNVRFRLVTNSNTEADGWYLDDIYLGTSQEADTVEQTSSAGWNIVSLPVLTPDASATTLFGGALTPAYGYTNAYFPEDTLENGRGYWVKFNPDEPIVYGGFTVLRDTVDVEEGWNLVGSVSVPIVASTVASIPASSIETPFYEYDGGYTVATNLQPGLGYWVKSSQTAKIVLSGFVVSTSRVRRPVRGSAGGRRR